MAAGAEPKKWACGVLGLWGRAKVEYRRLRHELKNKAVIWP
jgi:hypothetical protein